MPLLRAGVTRAALAFFLFGAGCAGAPIDAVIPGISTPSIAPPRYARVDYVVIAPRDLLAAMQPLLAHREAGGHVIARFTVEDLIARGGEGTPDADAVATAIRDVAKDAGTTLRYVLLVGDVPAPNEAARDFTPLPTFYLPKLSYEMHRSGEHVHPRPYATFEHDHGAPRTGEAFPSDAPYSVANRDAPGQPLLASARSPTPLAVGRVPARTAIEASDFAEKVIAYETSKSEGVWRRRIQVVGGPANFGPLADGLIESTATHLLDSEVPYDFDVRVLFPKIESAYAFPFADLERKMVADLDEGALIAAYVGHGAARSFEDVHFHDRWFEIGTTEDAARLAIPEGKPLFLSIACNTGAYDLPRGLRSLAEVMLLNPRGPIGVLASSRESHPYANALLGQGFLDAFVKARATSIGEGVVRAKQGMHDADIPLATLLFDTDADDLKDEHDGLYNLLGDPATVLRYPDAAKVTRGRGLGPLTPRADVEIVVEAPSVSNGAATLTVETLRSVIRGTLIPPVALEAMDDDTAWAAMRKNYAAASDKIVARIDAAMSAGRAVFHVRAPAAGDYELKVFAKGDGHAAAGHLRIHVAETP